MAEDLGNVEVDLIPDVDSASWKKKIQATMAKIGAVTVQVEPDVSRAAMTAFKKTLQTKLDAMNLTVNITPKITKGALQKSVRELNAAYKEKKNQPKVWLNPGFRLADVKRSIKDLNAALKAAGRPTIHIDVATKESIARAQAETAAFVERTSVMRQDADTRVANHRQRADLAAHQREMLNIKIEQRERERLSAIINKGLDASGVARYESAVMRSLKTLGKAWGVYATVSALAVAGIATAAIVSFAQLEDTANKASQVFANNIEGVAQKTAAEFVLMNREIRGQVLIGAGQIARATAFDLEQAAGSMRALAASGVDLETALGNTTEGIKGLGLTVAQFAQAAGIEDLELATDKLIAIQQQAAAAPAFTSVYKTQAEQVQRVADLVILASNKSLGNAQQLSEALANRVTGQLASMNRPLEEAVTLTAVLSQSGLLGKPGGEQASIIMRDLAIKANKFKDEFKALGVEVYDANGNLRAGTSILDELTDSLGKMSDQERVAALQSAGVTLRSQGVFSRLIATSTAIRREQGKSLVDIQEELRKDASGSVARQAEARLDTLSQQFAAFVEGVKVSLAGLGGGAARRITDFFKELNGDLTSGASSAFFDGLQARFGSFSGRLEAFVAKTIAILKTPEFADFASNVAESMILASNSILTFFQGIAFGMTGVREGSGALTAFGDTIRAISERLPEAGFKVGEFFGKIAKFASENKEILSTLAKAWLTLGATLFVIRRVLAPFVIIFRGLRAVFAAVTSGAGALGAVFRVLSTILKVGSVAVAAITAAVILAAGIFKGFFQEVKRGSERGAGLVDFFKTLAIVLEPVTKLLSFVAELIFDIGVAIGKFLGDLLNEKLQFLVEKMNLFIDAMVEVFRLIGKAPKMGWADDLADKMEKSRKGLRDVGKGFDDAGDSAERNSKRISKAIKPVNLESVSPAVGKGKSSLVDALVAGGNSEKELQKIRVTLSTLGMTEQTISARRELSIKRLGARYLELRKTSYDTATVDGKIQEEATRKAEKELAKRIKMQLVAQAKSVQILTQTGQLSKAEAEKQLATLQARITAIDPSVKIPVSVSESALAETKRKLDEVAKPRTAQVTIVEKIKGAGSKVLDIVQGVGKLKQQAELDKAIAQAQSETARLQAALGALRTGMRRPAVEAVKNFVAVILDIPRQFRIAINTISPQLIMLSQGVGKTLAAGMRSTIPLVGAAGVAMGQGAMAGLAAGLTSGFNTVIKPLLKRFTEEIPKLKGPIAYDSTLLQPAGSAIMGGFARGLESGFSDVRGWLKNVAPQIEESVPDNLMVQRTGQFLVDWLKSGKTLDPAEAFKDLVPQDQFGGMAGDMDPALGFMHKTASLRDTADMTATLAKMFGLTAGSLYRPGAITSSGKYSDHGKGLARDIYGSMGATDRMVAALKGLYPGIIKQLIWRNKDVNRGFYVPDHMDHAHVAIQPAANFGLMSGRIGAAAVQPALGGATGGVMNALARAAQAVGLPFALIKAIAKQESGFNPRAGSPAGARGLMQLMPATARALGVKNILDPYQNALGGAKYIKQQINTFKRVELALAAYNAGPGAVKRFGGIPPYRETQHYVKAVMQYFRQFGGFGQALGFGGFRANGGPVGPGQAYVVGERGRELFVPGQRGSVITNARLERLITLLEEQERKGKKGVTYQNNMTISSNATDPRAVASLIDSHNRYSMGQVLR